MNDDLTLGSVEIRIQPKEIRTRAHWNLDTKKSIDVGLGSWSCENALSEALRRGDDGEATVLGHFAEFGGSSCW